MADERCVYESVPRDASSLCEEIFVKWLAILMETFDQPNLPAESIFDTVVHLFRWIAIDSEVDVRHASDLKRIITGVVVNRACEHGARYKCLVKLNAFWDEKRLRTLKDARRATRHHHLPVEGIAPLLDWVKTWAKRAVNEQIKYVFHSNFRFDELFTVDASLQKNRIGT